ncbi:hypothetical protein MKZ38_000545 [Zalerion maritima]|uniref:Uncharacterized protein n=1 Tax=Zalerion maritima TaxID=339359 RepID=A0AAD5WSI2_9PEZI|nr:hypothetical protein MKZ38_000545 [Zalerion maritima]
MLRYVLICDMGEFVEEALLEASGLTLLSGKVGSIGVACNMPENKRLPPTAGGCFAKQDHRSKQKKQPHIQLRHKAHLPKLDLFLKLSYHIGFIKTRPRRHALGLRGPTTHITRHDAATGKEIFRSKRPVQWEAYDDGKLYMTVQYTIQFPADLNDDADVNMHDERMASGPMALVLGNGTVLRYVDFAPGCERRLRRRSRGKCAQYHR